MKASEARALTNTSHLTFKPLEAVLKDIKTEAIFGADSITYINTVVDHEPLINLGYVVKHHISSIGANTTISW